MKYKGFIIQKDPEGFTVISRTGAILGTFASMSNVYDLIDVMSLGDSK